MADEREGRGRGRDREEPYIRSEDRPDLTIDLDARLGDMTVRQLSAILAPGAGLFWKPLKDAKDRIKDYKDVKDIVDTGSPILKEIVDTVGIQHKQLEPGPGPLGGLGGLGGIGGMGAMGGMGGAGTPLDQLIERISGLERAVQRLERQASGERDRER